MIFGSNNSKNYKMKTKFNGFLTLLLALAVQITFAQEKTVTGKVSDASGPLPGVTVIVKGTNTGTQTDFDGNYSLKASTGAVLQFSFMGMNSVDKTIGTSNVINITMSESAEALEEVVVTALGITRDEKSLGYAVQKVGGEDVADVKTLNIMESLSGEVSGLDIQSYNQMGGSANIVVRGYSSLTGNNQALIVVDGTPINNGTGNSGNQSTGRGGFDYGNAAMDINPDNVASVSVLKGAAASALYGSQASNGVILITTKTGKESKDLGISINSTFLVGSIDDDTMPVYQKKYGAGYGPFYGGPDGRWDVHPDTGELAVLTGEDASYGPAYDSSLNVHHWYNLIPEYGNYNGTAPFVAPSTTAHDFFKNTTTSTNSVALGKSYDNGNFRINYTNVGTRGILPNSEIDRNTFSFNGTQEFGEKLTAQASITYTKTEGLGRYGTGYDNRNVFQSFRQWWQTNVDILQQKDVYEQTGKNYSWNMFGPGNTDPHYFDNPYWMRYNTYNTDERNRYFGNVNLTYKISDEFNVIGRVTYDAYDEIREERINIGSVDVPGYSFTDRNVSSIGYDIIASYQKDITDLLNIDVIAGWSLAINNWDTVSASTNGGLNFPGIYSLDNSVNPLTPDNTYNFDATKKTDAFFARASVGYDDTYFVEASLRRDRTSALPITNNTYYYPSVSGSLILSKLIDADWLTFAKLRGNYAEVGNDLGPYNVFRTYGINAGFNGQASASNPSTLNNADLKKESTKETEFGIEAKFLQNRLGVDVSFYNRTTDDLLTPLDVSTASGVSSIWLNGGSIENKGFEALVTATPVRTDNFSWDVKFNFARNRSKVLSLAEGLDFLQLASLQGGITIGAKVGEPYGVIRGRDYVYHANGGKVVYTSDDAPSGSYVGVYARTSESNHVLGNINPDWTGGVKNTFRYKDFDFSFLIDIQKGGSFFSLDTYYGYATGLYDFTAVNNDLGNPVRDEIADGGGVILDGVNADGNTNETRAYAGWYANPWGYARAPSAHHVHDASFVKLRELKFGYTLPQKTIDKLPFSYLNLSVIGRNLWIIHKNAPYTDPEAGLSAGNVQGYQSGAYPSIKELGVNLKIEF